MPVVAKLILPGSPMPRAFCKAPGFVGEWLLLLIGERPQRLITGKNAITVTALFGAGCTKLQVIFTVMFVHPGAFNKGQQKYIIVMFAKALPAVHLRVKLYQLFFRAYGFKGFAVNFLPVKWQRI